MPQLQDPFRVRRDDVAMIGPSETEVHRTPEEKERDLAILADIYYREPSQNHYQLADKFNAITGRTLTRSQITKNLAQIRNMVVENMISDMSIVVAEELMKLDAHEKAYWKLFYDAQDNVKRRIIDSVLRENEDGDMVEIIKGIRTVEEFSGDFSVKILGHIQELQKERRKLLGVYAYSAIEQERVIDVDKKGYVNVSPSDWGSRVRSNE